MSARSKVTVRELKDSEIEDAVSFHNEVEGEDRTAEEWIWEYKGHYPNLYVYSVAEDGGKIVGSQGMLPIYTNIEGENCLAAKSESLFLFFVPVLHHDQARTSGKRFIHIPWVKDGDAVYCIVLVFSQQTNRLDIKVLFGGF